MDSDCTKLSRKNNTPSPAIQDLSSIVKSLDLDRKSTPSSSFPTLPPELLREILELSVPHSFHSTTYRDRQRTLCSLCLVSYQFRAIAQPLLEEVVCFVRRDVETGLEVLSDQHSHEPVPTIELVGHHSKSEAGGGGAEQNSDMTLERCVEVCPKLHSLTFDCRKGEGTVHAYLVFLFTTELTSLHLNLDAKDLEPATSITLPPLQSLTLSGSSVEKLMKLFDPKHVPTLRYLCLVGDCHDSACCQFLPQLDVFSITYDFFRYLKSQLTASDISRTLVDIPIDRLELYSNWFGAEHLRILDPNPTKAEPFDIHGFVTEIALWKPDFSLSSIYLDTRLFVSPKACVQCAMGNLKSVCNKKGIEVIFEEQPVEPTIDSHLSPDFWEKRKAEKRVHLEETEAC
ncbi:uncharacterized protein JCM6883_007305 [Sporobolomyces salmoneus]|uniref:uncharacterized protein n=1 Tax=Sporobolomyces salmoneus TaxID=183962 RepID=UPI003170AE99